MLLIVQSLVTSGSPAVPSVRTHENGWRVSYEVVWCYVLWTFVKSKGSLEKKVRPKLLTERSDKRRFNHTKIMVNRANQEMDQIARTNNYKGMREKLAGRFKKIWRRIGDLREKIAASSTQPSSREKRFRDRSRRPKRDGNPTPRSEASGSLCTEISFGHGHTAGHNKLIGWLLQPRARNVLCV